MSTSKTDLAVSVLALLQSAKLTRDDEMLQQASDLARIETPGVLAGITPRFEAYFAIATLIRSLSTREDRASINRRFEHARSLTAAWVRLSSDADVR